MEENIVNSSSADSEKTSWKRLSSHIVFSAQGLADNELLCFSLMFS